MSGYQQRHSLASLNKRNHRTSISSISITSTKPSQQTWWRSIYLIVFSKISKATLSGYCLQCLNFVSIVLLLMINKLQSTSSISLDTDVIYSTIAETSASVINCCLRFSRALFKNFFFPSSLQQNHTQTKLTTFARKAADNL